MSKYEEGAKAEFVVAEMLKSDGWYIANASSLDEIAGDDGAPLVRGDNDAEITPDILAMKDGRTAWVEVKLKTTGAEYIYKNDQYEHFIDGKNWNSYLNIQSSSGCEVWLAIVEQPEQTLQRQLMKNIDVVGWWSKADVKKYNSTKYGEEGVFIPQSDFLSVDLPSELAGVISKQRQLNGSADPNEDILPDCGSQADSTTTDQQQGLGDFVDNSDNDSGAYQ